MDTKAQKDWNQEYYNQRRDRLADAVGDYLTCDTTSARQCYEEMLAEVDGWIKHHRQHLNKAQALKDLLMGERNANIEFPTKQFLQENTIPDRY